MELNTILQGNCTEVLKTLPSESVDCVVTDPPYELGFMGKSWDNTGIANNVDMWKECLRVLKSGGHLLSFGGTRTYHRMASAIEDAGFEIRDMIEWVYGSGFPKSLNIGKAVDKLQGNDREVIGVSEGKGYSSIQEKNIEQDNRPYVDGLPYLKADRTLTKGNSEWEGWGTALKPAHEPICMARKPLAEKTVAENCLKYGTGGINIDESRVEALDQKDLEKNWTDRKADAGFNGDKTGIYGSGKCKGENIKDYTPLGRFPANLIHDNSEEVRECFPETKSGAMNGTYKNTMMKGVPGVRDGKEIHLYQEASSGNASRFFKSIIYTAKASKSERNKGCEGLEDKVFYEMDNDHGNLGHFMVKKAGGEMGDTQMRKNNHPTVKPIALMEYLIKMVTREGQTVLDPFAGSGTTLIAAKKLGRKYIGIELEPEYVKIAEARLSSVPERLL